MIESTGCPPRTAIHRRGRLRALATGASLSLLVVVTACSDDDDAASDTVDVCETRDELEESVQALGDVDVVEDGTEEVDTAVADVRSALEATADAAGDALDDELEAAGSAMDDLEVAVATASEADGPAAAVEAVATALAQLSGAILAIGDELSTGC